MRYAEGVVLEPVGAVESGEDVLALSEAGAPMLSYVIIRRGDNLWRIARRNYGRGIKYQAIYAANRDQHPQSALDLSRARSSSFRPATAAGKPLTSD